MRTGSMVVALAAAFSCQVALAFGAEGHRAVGTIADALIVNTRAGDEVRKLLGSNLRTAAVWADCARSINEKTFKYGPRGEYPECEVYENTASETQLSDFVRRNVGNCIVQSKSQSCHREYHFANVATQRDAYRKGLVGTSDHDIVSAINACIAVLSDQASPHPFKIVGKKEALRLLAHYVGDIHQPLHVASVYLNRSGDIVDPDTLPADPDSPTTGGNDLLVGARSLHAIWDGVGGEVTATPPTKSTLKKARENQAPNSPLSEWSEGWASESLELGATKGFAGLQYSKELQKHKYRVELPGGYTSSRTTVQADQVIKAGARLAAILKAIWP